MKPALPHSPVLRPFFGFSSISLSSNLPQAPIKWIITAPKSSLRGFPLIPSRHLHSLSSLWWHNELLFQGEQLKRPLWRMECVAGCGQRWGVGLRSSPVGSSAPGCCQGSDGDKAKWPLTAMSTHPGGWRWGRQAAPYALALPESGSPGTQGKERI